jgi:DNA polymerase-3 subunit gamma/tau
MAETETAYRVLARKYRPTTFAELIGQEAMVRTLTNAIATGRIAHAFVLTGVRGVGKTTTARILARALNCVEGPTISPCGKCEPCRAIIEDRHVDVMEMDAASRTGVDDIRELTDGVRYKPVAARYKVYIIDEVHMLTKNAFNALLKTLEEPPPDVKFIFATTEIHKVPVTVLSRCQRFSLRRVPVELLAQHYARVAAEEGVAAEPGAIALVARAADGSVRDGLSILDQAIALGSGAVTEAGVREMLGVADRGLVFDLLEAVFRGDAAAALRQVRALYDGGADPAMVLQDLLELVHFLTRLKVVPSAGEGDPLVEGDRARGQPLAEKLGMPVLARAWQMLLKGLAEVQAAPLPLQAAEMVLVRLAYVADLPAPAELVRSLATNGGAPAPTPPRGGGMQAASPGTVASARMAPPPAAPPRGAPMGSAAQALAPTEAPAGPALDPMPQTFAEALALFDRHREGILRSQLANHVRIVSFEPGRIDLSLTEGAPPKLANRLGELLSEWTGQRWLVALSNAAGAPTVKEAAAAHEAELRGEAARHPLVQAVLQTFPGAKIEAVREIVADTEAAETDADTEES